MDTTYGYTWRPLARYAFIEIKFNLKQQVVLCKFHNIVAIAIQQPHPATTAFSSHPVVRSLT